MRLAAKSPQRQEMFDALDWWQNELSENQVSVRLNSRIDSLNDIYADEVVWAVGSTPSQTSIWRLRPWLRNGIPGSNKLPFGREILSGEKSLKGNVLVIDEEGGWSSISLVESLIENKDITYISVVTTENIWGESELTFTRELALMSKRIRAARINVITNTIVEEIRTNIVLTRDKKELGPFENIVLATGTSANQFPEGAKAVGDCLAPRGIWAATNDAAKLAIKI